MVILGVLGIVVLLFVVAAVIDLNARRRGVRYSVEDPRPSTESGRSVHDGGVGGAGSI